MEAQIEKAIKLRKQANFKILTRLAQHMRGYQHIDLSLKKHGLYSEKNPYRWRVVHTNCPESELDEKEQYYIIRADRAGVFAGNIKERNGSEVTMTNVRRIWYWDGAASLSQLAVDGTSNSKECKFTVTVPEMTVLGVIDIIPCTEKAETSIKGVAEWKI